MSNVIDLDAYRASKGTYTRPEVTPEFAKAADLIKFPSQGADIVPFPGQKHVSNRPDDVTAERPKSQYIDHAGSGGVATEHNAGIDEFLKAVFGGDKPES